MSFDVLGPGALDYLPCRYEGSKLRFRGPRRDLTRPYAAFLGGTETYGKFIEAPFPSLVEQRLGLACANFGQANAGIDVFMHDGFVRDAAKNAEIKVVQIVGAQNMTNRFYSVHPRRNDRFVACSNLLRTIYREVEFADIHFTKHLLRRLHSYSAERFEVLREELQDAWVARMRSFLMELGPNTVLLWFSEYPLASVRDPVENVLERDPLFITREMVEALGDQVSAVVEVVSSHMAGTEGMIFGELEEQAAENVLGVQAHQEAASALIKVMSGLRK